VRNLLAKTVSLLEHLLALESHLGEVHWVGSLHIFTADGWLDACVNLSFKSILFLELLLLIGHLDSAAELRLDVAFDLVALANEGRRSHGLNFQVPAPTVLNRSF